MPSQNELAAKLGLSVPNPRGPFYGNISQSELPPSAQGLGARVQRREDRKVLDISTNGQGVAAARVRVPMLGSTFEIRVDARDVEAFIQNPELARQVMERKFGEVRQMTDAVTQNMTPLQKAAVLASMQSGPAPNPVAGGLGAGADLEMYINDPDSRTLGNYLWSGLAAAGDFGPFAAMAMIPPVSVRRAMTNVPDFPVSPDIRVPAPAEVARTSRRSATTGLYYGAPRTVDNPAKLGALRKRLQDSLTRGMAGRNWYDNSYEAADFLTGGRQNYRRLYTGSNAVTSAGAQVAGNQGFGIKGYNQAITGNEIDTGRFPNQARTFLSDAIAGNPAQLGPKTGPFYEAQNVGDPDIVVGRPTNDIWMARAFDYRTPDGEIWSEGLGEAQHRFMDEEMKTLVDWANRNKIGGFDDWTPERAQAAIWVDTKAMTEGTTIEQAAYDFASELDRFKANINVEAEPARGLNHLAGTQNSMSLAEELQRAQRQAMSNERGQDLVSLYAGGLTTETSPGYGYYKGNSTPADVLGVLSGTSTGSNRMDPASRDLVEGIAATHGLLRGQESVGYNLLQKPKDVLDRNAASFVLGGAPTRESMLKFGGALDQEFGGAIIPVNTATGINALVVDDLSGWAQSRGIDPGNQFGPPTKEAMTNFAKAWQKQLASTARDTLGGVKPAWATNSGDLVGSWDGFKPSAYMQTIDRLNPQLQGRLDQAARVLSGPLDDIDTRLINQFPDAGQRSQIMTTTRQALSEGGFDRVRELVRQGVLPAVALGLGVRLLGPSEQSRQQTAETGAL